MRPAVAALALTFVAAGARAEEGPTGHYVPGGVSDFVDAVPSKATIVVRAHVLRYEGSGGALAMPIAGLTVTDVRETRWAFGVTAAVRPTYTLTPRLGWAASITVPLVHVAVSGDVAQRDGGTIARGESITGIGDLFVAPLMLLYALTPELSISGRVGLYMPTGRYQTGRLSNTGKNYFTLEPLLGLEYFGERNGIEVALHGGFDFNTMNKSTQYQTGTQTHVDATLAWHFQLGRGQAGAGASGYWYRQLAADSGVGATLGSFEARSLGVGPVASYLFRVRNIAVAMDLRWTRDLGVRNRLEGDLWFLKAVAAL